MANQRDITPNRVPQARGPARVTQATSVEQQRATAEVLGSILAAQQVPRHTPDCIAAMEEACAESGVAAVAFFAVPRAGTTINGESIHLARELARCWGHMDYGITELERDDDAGTSHVIAFARDVQTNTRSSTTFVIPHRRGGKNSPTLVDVDDIYLNNANYGARRMREQILAVLPTWFVARGAKACRDTIEHGGGVPLATRIANAIRVLGELGINRARIEAKVGSPADAWTPKDVADLGVLYQSVQQGTVLADEAFPRPQTVTGEQIRSGTAPRSEPPGPRMATPQQKRDLAIVIGKAGITGTDARHFVAARFCRVDGVLLSFDNLTFDQAKTGLDTLTAADKAGTLRELVDGVLPDEGDPVWAEIDAAKAAAEKTQETGRG